MVKILIFDIETTPSLAYVWRFFKENISPKQVKENGYLLSFAAKWYGEDGVIYHDSKELKEKALLKEIVSLMDEADIVVAHNADRFDVPMVKGRCLVHGIKPPSPFKSVDTLKVAKAQFRFPSNSLEYLADVLGCAPKMTKRKFPGFELWKEVIQGNPEAWEELCEYNIQDVHTLEEVYEKMIPWVTNHPNVGLINGQGNACPKCGSTHIHFRGYAYTNVSKFHRFQCQDCGGWGRTRTNEVDKELRRSITTNVPK